MIQEVISHFTKDTHVKDSGGTHTSIYGDRLKKVFNLIEIWKHLKVMLFRK